MDRRMVGKVVGLLRLFWVEVLTPTLALISTLILEEVRMEEGKEMGKRERERSGGGQGKRRGRGRRRRRPGSLEIVVPCERADADQVCFLFLFLFPYLFFLSSSFFLRPSFLLRVLPLSLLLFIPFIINAIYHIY